MISALHKTKSFKTDITDIEEQSCLTVSSAELFMSMYYAVISVWMLMH